MKTDDSSLSLKMDPSGIWGRMCRPHPAVLGDTRWFCAWGYFWPLEYFSGKLTHGKNVMIL